ncbi:hypothetical protein QQX98_013114 [Neonectria punicea]|uniref:Uncharacterized protein n=1 Tax=Neonectria punicea TaxID=979145 RepID=A0ABR1GHB2_9HYPO
MSDFIDPRVVEAACMADLSRARQEELPLSSVAKKGPSFDPRGKNGTNHYPTKLKQDLNNRWKVTIDDEESRQIEGLHLDNARPWGKQMAKQIMESNPTESASAVRQQVKGPSRKHQPQPQRPQAPQDVVLATAPKSSPETHSARENAAHLRLELAQKPENPDSPEVLICTGRCEVVPEKQESGCFEVEFKMVLFTKAVNAFLHLTAAGRGKRVHGMLDFEAPIMDGLFCKLTHQPSSSDYFLRLADLEETEHFMKCVQALQQTMTVHLQRKTAEANLSNNQAIETPQPSAAASQPDKDLIPATHDQATRTSSSAIEDLASISAEAEEVGSVSATADETLINLDDFEEVHNSQIPCLLNATEHIVHLVENVMVHYALEDHLVDSVIEGIEDGAIEYWVQHGFMRDCEDEIKENLIAVLRNMAQIKIKMHLRQSGRDKKQNKPVQAEVDRCTEAIAEQVRRVQYSPGMLESLQQLAVVPDDWKATKDLPVSATVVSYALRD